MAIYMKKGSGLITSPHPVSDETKSSGSMPSPHPVHDEANSSGSTPSPHPLDTTAQNLKWQSISNQEFEKLEKTRNMLEIVLLCMLSMLNFKRLALIATEM